MKNSLLLHVCCAGCLVKAVSALAADDSPDGQPFDPGDQPFDNETITLYFDNSNIHPRTEWAARLEAVQRAAEDMGLELIVADWSPKKWFEAIKCDPKNSRLQRCKRCWEMRLGETAEKASEIGAPSFSTTLLSSKYQNREEIIPIGIALEQPSLKFVTFSPDWEKRSSVSFYRQNYCGCGFSLTERYIQKHCE